MTPRIGFILGLLLAFQAEAVVVSRQTDFEPNTKAEADQVDAEFDNILSAINGNLSAENILDGSIASGDLASASVTTAKIQDLAVTTEKIAANAVTRAKQELVGEQMSASTTVTIYDTPTYTNATGLTAALTSTGARPVVITFVDGRTGNPSIVSGTSCAYRVTDNGAEVFRGVLSVAGGGVIAVPPGTIYHVGATSNTSHTYQLQAYGDVPGAYCQFTAIKMLVYEL